MTEDRHMRAKDLILILWAEGCFITFAGGGVCDQLDLQLRWRRAFAVGIDFSPGGFLKRKLLWGDSFLAVLSRILTEIKVCRDLR